MRVLVWTTLEASYGEPFNVCHLWPVSLNTPAFPSSWIQGGGGALERKGRQRRPQRRLGRRLEEVAEAVGGGYCRLQMPLKPALAVRGTVAGHRLGAVEGGGFLPPLVQGDTPPPPVVASCFNTSPGEMLLRRSFRGIPPPRVPHCTRIEERTPLSQQLWGGGGVPSRRDECAGWESGCAYVCAL